MKTILLLMLISLVAMMDAVWWATANQALMDPTRLCLQGRRLKGRRAETCRKEPKILQEIARGAQLATKECQFQFQNRLWNCTTARKSLRIVLTHGTRETAFVNAIVAAGVTYKVTQACSSGTLIQCTCDRSVNGLPTDGKWEWDGCADNINYGIKISRKFMDARYRKRSDLLTQVMLHNLEAGRLALKNYMGNECKCHGLSGSCTVRTCWKKMPRFRDVGNRLKEKFDGSSKVIPGNDGQTIVPEGSSIKPPTKEDLIYSEESPDYCIPNRSTGSLGTVGRICNSKSPGVDGCELLCCGRGYRTHRKTYRVNCKCRFHWCCEVTCETCYNTTQINVCR